MYLSWLCTNSELTPNAGARNNWCRQIGLQCCDLELGSCQQKHYVRSLSVICALLLQGPAFVFLPSGVHVYTAFCAPSLWGQPTPLKQTHTAVKKKKKNEMSHKGQILVHILLEPACCRSLITTEWRGLGMSSGSLSDSAAAANTQAVSMNMKLF